MRLIACDKAVILRTISANMPSWKLAEIRCSLYLLICSTCTLLVLHMRRRCALHLVAITNQALWYITRVPQ